MTTNLLLNYFHKPSQITGTARGNGLFLLIVERIEGGPINLDNHDQAKRRFSRQFGGNNGRLPLTFPSSGISERGHRKDNRKSARQLSH